MSRVRDHDAQRRAHLLHDTDRSSDEVDGVMRLMERGVRRPRAHGLPLPPVARRPRGHGEVRRQPRDVGEGRARSCADVLQELGLPFYRGAGRGGVLRAEDRHPVRDGGRARRDARRRSRSTSTCRTSSSLEYIGEDGERHQPIIVHRGVISTMERMVALLIEEYAGAFPLWLAPVQARRHPDRRPPRRVRATRSRRSSAQPGCASKSTLGTSA